MDLTLKRQDLLSSGIFGKLLDKDGKLICYTLERAYLTNSYYSPKMPNGFYECRRGIHKLHDGKDFETFEIMGVKDHKGILFHIGNFNCDSDGCVLLGMERMPHSIKDSRAAFEKFMKLQDGVNSFFLSVI